jgi:hypothetical protein
VPWRGRALTLRNSDLLAGPLFEPPTFNSERQFEKNSFLKERSLNIIENKGPLWKTRERSWNVYENAGT